MCVHRSPLWERCPAGQRGGKQPRKRVEPLELSGPPEPQSWCVVARQRSPSPCWLRPRFAVLSRPGYGVHTSPSDEFDDEARSTSPSWDRVNPNLRCPAGQRGGNSHASTFDCPSLCHGRGGSATIPLTLSLPLPPGRGDVIWKGAEWFSTSQATGCSTTTSQTTGALDDSRRCVYTVARPEEGRDLERSREGLDEPGDQIARRFDTMCINRSAKAGTQSAAQSL